MYKEIFLAVMAVIFISSNVLAFAVSSQYYGGNPLYLQPGESTETFFTLQNLASTEDVRLQAKITEGENIVKLTDLSEIYNVPAGEKTKVNFLVTAPANAKKGDTFPVSMEFTTAAIGGGPIALSGSVGKGFNLVIGKDSDFTGNKTQSKFSWTYLIVALIVALVIVIYFVFKKKKFSKK